MAPHANRAPAWLGIHRYSPSCANAFDISAAPSRIKNQSRKSRECSSGPSTRSCVHPASYLQPTAARSRAHAKRPVAFAIATRADREPVHGCKLVRTPLASGTDTSNCVRQMRSRHRQRPSSSAHRPALRPPPPRPPRPGSARPCAGAVLRAAPRLQLAQPVRSARGHAGA